MTASLDREVSQFNCYTVYTQGRGVKLGRLILSVLFPLYHCCERTCTLQVCLENTRGKKKRWQSYKFLIRDHFLTHLQLNFIPTRCHRMLDLVILLMYRTVFTCARFSVSKKSWVCSRTIATYKKKHKTVYDYRNGDFGELLTP